MNVKALASVFQYIIGVTIKIMQYICTMDIILIEPHYIGNCSYWNVLLRAEQIVLDYKEHLCKKKLQK